MIVVPQTPSGDNQYSQVMPGTQHSPSASAPRDKTAPVYYNTRENVVTNQVRDFMWVITVVYRFQVAMFGVNLTTCKRILIAKL